MSDIARKSLETFIVRIGIQLLGVIGGVVIARELGPASKGMYTYVTTVAGTILMFWAGQSGAIVWQYGRGGRSARDVLRAAIPIVVTGAVAGTAIVLGLAAKIPEQRVLFTAAAALPFALYAQMTTGFFLADSDVRSINAQQTISTALPVFVYAPLLLFWHGQLSTVLWTWVAAWAATALFSWFCVAKRVRADTSHSSEKLVGAQVKYGFQMSLNSVVSYLNYRIDVFIVLFILGQQALGVYSIGIALGELVFQITRPIVTAATGRIARSTERESAEITAKCMRHSLALVMLCSVAVYFVGPPLVVAVYGAKFAGAGEVLRYLLPGVIAYSAMPVLAAFFSQQLGKPRIPLLLSTVSTVICAAVTFAILQRVGIRGGAIATSVSYFTAFVLAVAYFLRRTGMPASKLFLLSSEDLDAYRRVMHALFTFVHRRAYQR